MSEDGDKGKSQAEAPKQKSSGEKKAADKPKLQVVTVEATRNFATAEVGGFRSGDRARLERTPLVSKLLKHGYFSEVTE